MSRADSPNAIFFWAAIRSSSLSWYAAVTIRRSYLLRSLHIGHGRHHLVSSVRSHDLAGQGSKHLALVGRIDVARTCFQPLLLLLGLKQLRCNLGHQHLVLLFR